ncbi:SDR family NAD(P)-dependent oxidoreductase [Muricauda sp. JGD-17]|uniref:SDR family NAD(P)-dependent oxidoreductase n=1 Tax=Flagellimonas ochracea TaxID=2696472 RepID=A0A964WW77_9FLAO|nr:SDR family oxidoreductase [Allomuricauda ochracea]NAY90746.1 SDR family NAD(P)-dependent oxidoreductase [Allomuricauda ochracea]
MDKKVILITGGSSGIGKSIGTFLTSKGNKVYGTTRNLNKHTDFDAFELLQLDVKSPESIQKAVSQIVSKEGKLDVLVNNAGVGITGPVEETPHEEILNVFDTNFHGPVHMMKAVLPQMRKQGGGLIINITSIAGYMGLPFRGYYSATKGALGLITEALRMETKDFGIKITNVAPGDFTTNIAAGRYHAPVAQGSAYEQVYQQSLDLMNQHVDAGGDPMMVARKVYKIIQKQKPKIHYPVGAFMQKISLFLKKILPGKVYEKLLLNHYKL